MDSLIDCDTKSISHKMRKRSDFDVLKNNTHREIDLTQLPKKHCRQQHCMFYYTMPVLECFMVAQTNKSSFELCVTNSAL